MDHFESFDKDNYQMCLCSHTENAFSVMAKVQLLTAESAQLSFYLLNVTNVELCSISSVVSLRKQRHI